MILFTGHEASRTGAPKVLYDFLAWLKANEPETEAQILLGKGGDFFDAFSDLYPTEVWKLPYPETINLWQRIDNKLFNTFYKNQQKYIRRFEKQDIKLIFSNTCTNGPLLEQLDYLKCPLITFVHEMEGVIRIFNQNGRLSRTLERSQHLIVPSLATKNNLVKNHHISPDKITVCYNGIDENFNKNTRPLHIRKKYRIPENAFVVGACGTADFRKGADLFLHIAYRLQKNQNIYFLWAGSFPNPAEKYWLTARLQKSNLKNVFFIGPTKNPAGFLSEIDVFALTSREDPFPLVSLEAGLCAKPIICFKNAGGTPELLNGDHGFIVPFGDIDSFADQILFLKNSPDILKKMGPGLARKIKTDFNSRQTLPKIRKVIKQFL